MTQLSRRAFTAGALALGGSLSGCSAARISSTRGEIDAQVDRALATMYATVPGSQGLAERAVAMLVMPRMSEMSFLGGGSYGEGALLIGGAKVDYYSAIGASFGLQIGAQRYAHTLLFMTREALAGFRAADGWELGVDAGYVVPQSAAAATVTTSTYAKPIYALIYGQQGLVVGASVEGGKYSRIVR